MKRYGRRYQDPQENSGGIIGDRDGRRGRIMGMEVIGAMQVISAQAPLSEIQRNSADLRSITSGRGSYATEFSHYEELPAHLIDGIVSKSK